MSRIFILGATGSLGGHVLRIALASGHEVTAFVRDPSRLPATAGDRITVHRGDLARSERSELASLIAGHDALINCAGNVADGQQFVELFDRVVTAAESVPAPDAFVCWFLAGAAMLDIDASGRRGVDLPKVRATYWPHRANFERVRRTGLNWRLLCPGPMVDTPVLGAEKLRLSIDRLPAKVPAFARALPAPFLLPVFASLIPQMIVAYADAAAVMLAHLDPGDAVARHRVGLALPEGMRGSKPRWTATARQGERPHD